MNNVSTLPISTAAFDTSITPKNYIDTWGFADRLSDANFKDLVVIVGCLYQLSQDDPELKEAIDNVMKEEAA